ncbi:radical SAM protein [Candidatus Fermentibacteria bacterium]|nr:radical SAM protein [Candidatus Fermentibacteria bacterium]
MLALVEPHMGRTLVDAPNLGCAMLIGACTHAGIQVRLVRGQTRWLEDMFRRDAVELWDLIAGLDETAVRRLRIEPYRRYVLEEGSEAFAADLAHLYESVVSSRDPRRLFHAQRAERLGNLATAFLAVYEGYATNRDEHDLAFVNRYVDEILRGSPHSIGFSLQCSFDPLTRAIRHKVRTLTDAPIIVGGALTPFIPHPVSEELFQSECFDYLIVGEGEDTLIRLIEALQVQKNLDDIPNLVYRTPEGAVRHTTRQAIEDLGRLPPPDFSQFDLPRLASADLVLPMQTARGCPWGRCAFCSHHSIYGGSYRTFEIERIVEWLRQCRDDYGCTHFALTDEDLPAQRALAIAEGLEAADLEGLSFYAYARMTRGYTDDQTLERLSGAGFASFSWGLESGSQRVLDRMHKGTQVRCIEQVLQRTAAAGIANQTFVMFGFPGETKEDARHTVELLERHAGHIASVSACVFDLEPTSPVGLDPGHWGITTQPPGSYAVSRGLSHHEAMVVLRRFQFETDMRLRTVTWDRLRYLLPGHNRRILLFLAASHGLMDTEMALACLDQVRHDEAFPMVLGEIHESSRVNLSPVAVHESLAFHRTNPPTPREITPTEGRLIRLADGTLSVRRLIETLECADDVASAALVFLRDLIAHRHALLFSIPWHHKTPADYYSHRVTVLPPAERDSLGSV